MRRRARAPRRLPHELQYSAEYGLLPRLPQRGDAPTSLVGAKRLAAVAQLLALVGIVASAYLSAPFEVFCALIALLVAPPLGVMLAARRQGRPGSRADEVPESSRSNGATHSHRRRHDDSRP